MASAISAAEVEYNTDPSDGITINGAFSEDEYATVSVGKYGKKNDDKEFELWSDYTMLYDWGLTLTLKANNFGFESYASGVLKSKITITISGNRESTKGDLMTGFGVGDASTGKYFTFMNDFDGALTKTKYGTTNGIYIYPQSKLADGDVTTILNEVAGDSEMTTNTKKFNQQRAKMAGGNTNNWYRCTGNKNMNDNTWPIEFVIENDYVKSQSTVKFISATRTDVACVYPELFPSGQDIKFVMNADIDEERLKITSIKVTRARTVESGGIITSPISNMKYKDYFVEVTAGTAMTSGEASTDEYYQIESGTNIGPDNWNPLLNWGMLSRLDSYQYGFESDISYSTIKITVNAVRLSNEADLMYGFGVNNKYISFMHDIDGSCKRNYGAAAKSGIWIYPACNGELATGDVREILKEPARTATGTGKFDEQRKAMAGGSYENFDQLSSTSNGKDVLPITVQLTNDNVNDLMIFKFISATFPAGLECTFKGRFDTDSDVYFGINPDVDNEKTKINSIAVERLRVQASSGVIVPSHIYNGGSYEYITISKGTGLTAITETEFSLASTNHVFADWALSLALKSAQYAFDSVATTTISITIAGKRDTSDGDLLSGFGVGDESTGKYFTLLSDFDGKMKKNYGATANGIWIYPACGLESADGQLATGDVTSILDNLKPDTSGTKAAMNGQRNGMAGGVRDNFQRITSKGNGNTWPITFKVTNNPSAGQVTVKLISNSLPDGTVECTFNDKFAADSNLNFVLNPDTDNEELSITSITIEREVEQASAAAPGVYILSLNDFNSVLGIMIGVIGILLIINICVVYSYCFGVNNKARRSGYSSVKYVDSEQTDQDEMKAINVVSE